MLLGLRTSSTGAGNVERLHCTALDDELARVRHDRVAILGSGTSIANVGLEHVRKRVEIVHVVRTTSDFDGSAVHVHLPIANLIEPSPCESGTFGGWELLGDVERQATCVLRSGTSAFERLDRLEFAFPVRRLIQ